MADIIGKEQERRLRGEVQAEEICRGLIRNLVQDAQENPVEPTPIVVRGAQARRLLAQDRPDHRSRGWHRERGATRITEAYG
jgi:hypothetical protein